MSLHWNTARGWVIPEWFPIDTPFDLQAVFSRGAIVATCELKDCRPTNTDRDMGFYQLDSGIWWQVPKQENAFGDYSPGRYAWLLANVRALPEPIPAKGALGLWEWEGEEQAELQR
jgi:hypothetical protein